MSELSVVNQNLPSSLDDLSRFVLVGREKLVAVRAAIRAIDKVGVAQEVREQKLREAQEISEAVLDAEVRIGELTARLPEMPGKSAAPVSQLNLRLRLLAFLTYGQQCP